MDSVRRRSPTIETFASAGALGMAAAGVAWRVTGSLPAHRGGGIDFSWSGVAAAGGYGLVALLLSVRRPGHLVGRLALAAAFPSALAAFLGAYGVAVLSGKVTLPAGQWALWVSQWAWVPGYCLPVTLFLLFLPDGRLPSPRYRPFVALSVLIIAVDTLIWALTPYDRLDTPPPVAGAANPVGVSSVGGLAPLHLMLAVVVVVSFVVVVCRYRCAAGIERQQMKWVLLGGMGMLLMLVTALAAGATNLAAALLALAMVPLPATIGIAVLRHRLWDIDRIFSSSFTYGGLTLIVVATYVIAVGLLGGSLGRATGAPLVATVVVALAAQPLRSRLQHWANRRVFGDRDEPGAALARLGEHLAAARPPAESLRQVTRLVASALGSPHVAVIVPGVGTVAQGKPVSDVIRVELVHQGVSVGTLVVGARAPGESFSARDRTLLENLARQIGLATHAMRLLGDLQHSREGLVLAREEERRRLRRDLHDELGPLLAGAALQLEAVKEELVDTPAVERTVSRVTTELQGAIAQVRRLVDDLRPPALDDLGLVGALRQQADRFTTPTFSASVHAEGCIDGLPAAVDLAAFRIASEALVNTARHAHATVCAIHLHVDGDLRLIVIDDGQGIDESASPGIGLLSMRERAAELGGRCTVDSVIGQGTQVAAVIPLALAR